MFISLGGKTVLAENYKFERCTIFDRGLLTEQQIRHTPGDMLQRHLSWCNVPVTEIIGKFLSPQHDTLMEE